jgi:hypothetical protein
MCYRYKDCNLYRTMDRKKIWLGVAGVCVGLTVFKQVVWKVVKTEITDNRAIEAEKATKSLNETYTNAAAFKLEPLSKEHRELLKSNMENSNRADISKFTHRESQEN